MAYDSVEYMLDRPVDADTIVDVLDGREFPEELVDDAGSATHIPHREYDVGFTVAEGVVEFHYHDNGRVPERFEETVKRYLDDVVEVGDSAIPIEDVIEDVYEPEFPKEFVDAFSGPYDREYDREGVMSDPNPK